MVWDIGNWEEVVGVGGFVVWMGNWLFYCCVGGW